MEKINFENLKEPALCKEVLMPMQDNIEEAIETVNVMKAYQTSAQIANQNQKVNLQSYESVGEALTFENGGIKIGAGISYIQVYAQIFFEYIPSDQNYFRPRINKNDETVATKLNTCPPNEDYVQADIWNSPIPVQEGDLITLNFGDVTDKQPTTRAGKNETYLVVTALSTHIPDTNIA